MHGLVRRCASSTGPIIGVGSVIVLLFCGGCTASSVNTDRERATASTSTALATEAASVYDAGATLSESVRTGLDEVHRLSGSSSSAAIGQAVSIGQLVAAADVVAEVEVAAIELARYNTETGEQPETGSALELYLSGERTCRRFGARGRCVSWRMSPTRHTTP